MKRLEVLRESENQDKLILMGKLVNRFSVSELIDGHRVQ